MNKLDTHLRRCIADGATQWADLSGADEDLAVAYWMQDNQDRIVPMLADAIRTLTPVRADRLSGVIATAQHLQICGPGDLLDRTIQGAGGRATRRLGHWVLGVLFAPVVNECKARFRLLAQSLQPKITTQST